MSKETNIPPGYKPSPLGPIPKDWEVNTIGEMTELVNGLAFKPSDWKTIGYPIIRIQNLNGSNIYNYFDGTVKEKNLIRKGDVLFSWSGSVGTSFGSFIWDGPEGVLNQHIFKVYPLNNHNKSFLFYALRHTTELIERRSHGSAGLVHVTKGQLEKEKLPLPPLPEQKAIADVLSTWDEAIKTTTELIKAKEQRKQYLMQTLLAGKKRLKGFEGEWKEYEIEEICEVGRGRVISKIEIINNPGIYPVFSSQTENDGCMGHISTFDFEGEYITWTTDGIYAGTIFYRNGRFNCTNVCGTLKLNQNKFNTRYVAYSLSMVAYKYVSKTLANPKLMNNVMKEVVLKLPSLEEQTAIAAVLQTADAELQLLNDKLTQLKQQKKGLMQQLLTGKKRLKLKN